MNSLFKIIVDAILAICFIIVSVVAIRTCCTINTIEKCAVKRLNTVVVQDTTDTVIAQPERQ